LKPISSGTPALRRRLSSAAHDFGKYSACATGRLASWLASDSVTATWQFAGLPSCPQYWCDTPTECRPFLGKPESSTIKASIAPRRSMAGNTSSRTFANTAASDHPPWPTKCSSD
jgi:hypothetical protein